MPELLMMGQKQRRQGRKQAAVGIEMCCFHGDAWREVVPGFGCRFQKAFGCYMKLQDVWSPSPLLTGCGAPTLVLSPLNTSSTPSITSQKGAGFAGWAISPNVWFRRESRAQNSPADTRVGPVVPSPSEDCLEMSTWDPQC